MTMKTDITSMGTKIAVIANDVKYIKKALDGNGEPGIIRDTRENTDFRIECQTKSRLTRYAVGSGWVLVILIILLQIGGVI